MYANVTVSFRLSKRVEKSTGSGSLKILPVSFFSAPKPISVMRSLVHSATLSTLGIPLPSHLYNSFTGSPVAVAILSAIVS